MSLQTLRHFLTSIGGQHHQELARCADQSSQPQISLLESTSGKQRRGTSSNKSPQITREQKGVTKGVVMLGSLGWVRGARRPLRDSFAHTTSAAPTRPKLKAGPCPRSRSTPDPQRTNLEIRGGLTQADSCLEPPSDRGHLFRASKQCAAARTPLRHPCLFLTTPGKAPHERALVTGARDRPREAPAETSRVPGAAQGGAVPHPKTLSAELFSVFAICTWRLTRRRLANPLRQARKRPLQR